MTVENDARRTNQSGRGASRRTLVAGTAWTLPAVVVATAAPAFAGSTAASCAYTFGNIGQSCRYLGPGNHYYQVRLRVDRVLSCFAAPVTLNVTITGSPTPLTDTGTVTFGQGVAFEYVNLLFLTTGAAPLLARPRTSTWERPTLVT